MAAKSKHEAQNPLILRCNRIMDGYAKSDDERDFYLDRLEGFMIYVDLDKPQQDLEALEAELKKHADRYVMIPKLTFYETKKIMEGFVNEKVYDIDTKEKLLDIIQSKEARENFLEFIYDHHSELEKWQQYYQERSRIRIIEWLRNNHFHFVFEEDLDIPKSMLEKLKRNLFDTKVQKDISVARKALVTKAKTYYSNEALNPRPKRGRPPKQAAKQELEPQVSTDIYTTVPQHIRQFLFIPDITSTGITFSSKFESQEQMLASRKQAQGEGDLSLESLNQKLATLRSLSSQWITKEKEKEKPAKPIPASVKAGALDIEDLGEEEEEEEETGLNGWKPGKKLPAKQPKPIAVKPLPKKTVIIPKQAPAIKKKALAPLPKAKKPPLKKVKKTTLPKIKLKVNVSPKKAIPAKKVQKIAKPIPKKAPPPKRKIIPQKPAAKPKKKR